MTDRGLPSADASPACPFVAFEDDRDERADRPDHRHRCYAESEPAPRALAHQEAYCLSSAFPVCPVFQDWARREAAHATPGSTSTAPPAMPDRAASVTAEDEGEVADDADQADPADQAGQADDSRREPETPIEETPRRNPPRDWAAPPPWASTSAAGTVGAAGAQAGSGSDASGFLAPRPSEGQGLVGSAADRLAAGEDIVGDRMPRLEPRGRTVTDHPAAGADPELAGLVGGAAATGRDAGGGRPPSEGYPPVARAGRRPTVSSTRDRDRERERERERAAAAAERSGSIDGPAWERQRRFEAYPQIRTRVGLPGVPRVAVLAVALVIAAIALFVIGPDLLGIGGGADDPGASPRPTVAAATASLEPTPIPEPTPQVYVIKAGDTLSKIAREFGLTVEQLLAANSETIEDPDRIVVGNEIIIPVPSPDEVDGGSPSP